MQVLISARKLPGGPTGLLAWLLSPDQWAAIPGNSVANAAGVIVVAAIFDIVTPHEVPANNPSNEEFHVSSHTTK